MGDPALINSLRLLLRLTAMEVERKEDYVVRKCRQQERREQGRSPDVTGLDVLDALGIHPPSAVFVKSDQTVQPYVFPEMTTLAEEAVALSKDVSRAITLNLTYERRLKRLDEARRKLNEHKAQMARDDLEIFEDIIKAFEQTAEPEEE